jgi:hypothetical protein
MTTRLCTLLAAFLFSQWAWPTAGRAADEPPVTMPPRQTALSDAATDARCLDALAQQDTQLKAMQQDLHRLHREIALLTRDQGKPGLAEILGGIGYIIGLFGLATWFHSRNRNDS